MTEKYLDLTKEQLKAFIELPADGPFKMLNLLKFKDKVEGSEMSGADAYKKYMKAALPFFETSKAKIIFFGAPQFTLIGPPEEVLWDKILIIEYAEKNDFVKMITTPGYPAPLRNVGLEDSRLIFCK